MKDYLTTLTIDQDYDSRRQSQYACKQWIQDYRHAAGELPGTWRVIGYDKPEDWRTKRLPIDLSDGAIGMLSPLQGLASDPYTIAIHGCLLPDVDDSQAVKRRGPKVTPKGPPWFSDANHLYQMFDLDNGTVWPMGRPAETQAEMLQAARHNWKLYAPPGLADADLVVQLSNSIGFSDHFKAHFWVALDRPTCNESWRRFLRKRYQGMSVLPLDPTVHKAVQPLYTADPIVRNGPDPMAELGIERVFFVEGKRRFGTPPKSILDLEALEAADAPKKSARKPRPPIDATEEEVEAVLLERLRAYCDDIRCAAVGARHEAANKAGYTMAGWLSHRGAPSHGHVYRELVAAAIGAGMPDSRARDEVKRGMDDGTMQAMEIDGLVGAARAEARRRQRAGSARREPGPVKPGTIHGASVSAAPPYPEDDERYWADMDGAVIAGREQEPEPCDDGEQPGADDGNASTDTAAETSASDDVEKQEGQPESHEACGDGEGPDTAAETSSEEKEQEEPKRDESWRRSLIWTEKGGLRNCQANVNTILAHDEQWDGVVGFDLFRDRIAFRKDPPWFDDDAPAEPAKAWVGKTDVPRLQAWFARRWGFEPTQERARSGVLVAALRCAFHPVKQYLESLEWDKTERVDCWLENYCGVDADGEDEQSCARRDYVRNVGRWWLLSAVARVFDPGCKVDHILVLEGDQGVKKSSTFKALMHDESWFTDSHIEIGSKDAMLSLRGKWIVEFAEFDGIISRKEAATLKGFLTSATDYYRKPYDTDPKDHPRGNVFGGSVNKDEYLRDETGNRRYWPVKAGRVDLEGLARDRDQLWAEVVALYRKGGRWWPDDSEAEQAKAEQAERFVGDPWEDCIATWVEGRSSVALSEVLTTALRIDHGHQEKRHQMRAASTLKNLGFVRKRVSVNGKRKWVYQRDGGVPQPTPEDGPF